MSIETPEELVRLKAAGRVVAQAIRATRASRYDDPRAGPDQRTGCSHAPVPALDRSLITRTTRAELRYDHTRRRGVVFYMLSSVEPLATVGMTAIADTPQKAEELHAHARTILARADHTSARRDHAMPVRAALSTES